ncbi:unnamed protein product [Lactuca saligna]|uniref:3-oxoacyl-[acyl-carrier-protein] reductase n=1 Tax=Lactuca saligna TaxID=75948 RepID=A0AA35YUM6_LACSI|nr:unnamed protein product [Lactuca saligna]
MDLIHKLLNLILPVLTIILLLLLYPMILVFRFFNYFIKVAFPEELAGKVALITGASSGIGEHLAYEYAKRGARLALVARRKEQLEVVAGRARELGSPEVIVISADVSKVDDCKRFVDETIHHFGSLNHLVNNAGVCYIQDEDQRCSLDYVSLMDINFWGSVYATQFAVPHLRNSKGKIVVISSCAGWFALPKLGIYCASKAALIRYFETLRVEFGSDIRITIVTPGVVKSEITSDKWLLQSNLYWAPMVSTEDCVKTILDSIRRGDEYLTEPRWMRVFFMWKTLCPEILEWITRFLLITCSKYSQENKKPCLLDKGHIE